MRAWNNYKTPLTHSEHIQAAMEYSKVTLPVFFGITRFTRLHHALVEQVCRLVQQAAQHLHPGKRSEGPAADTQWSTHASQTPDFPPLSKDGYGRTAAWLTSCHSPFRLGHALA
jgi:hypothetical protein